MANDIYLAFIGRPIKNGTAVVSTLATGQYSVLDTSVSNTPAIADIQDKYDVRFDDPSYYYGGGADGGNIT
jgi:hypothetical protein